MVLLKGNKISKDARERLKILCATNDGFKVAEKDLEIRGPGEIEGTRQSGALNFMLASLVNDKAMLEAAKNTVEKLLETDPDILLDENLPVKDYLKKMYVEYLIKNNGMKVRREHIIE